MMRLPQFRLVAARSAQEASKVLLAEGSDARLVAGGTDLYPNLKRGHQTAKTLVSLRRTALSGIHGDLKQGFTIGAMTPLDSIVRHPEMIRHYPGLVRAVASISTPTLRHMGTIGGNLCLDTRCTYYNQNAEWRAAIDHCKKCEGSVCWVAPSSPRCWAISAADSVPMLIAMGARVRITNGAAEREIPLEALYRDDGMEYLTLTKGDVLTALLLPPAGQTSGTYWKLRRRGSIDFPVLGVGATLRVTNGTVEHAKIVLGAVASAPIDATKAASCLIGRPLTAETCAEAGRLARTLATPLDNTDFAMQWRAKMVEVYVDGVLREIGGLPGQTKSPTHGSYALAT